MPHGAAFNSSCFSAAAWKHLPRGESRSLNPNLIATVESHGYQSRIEKRKNLMVDSQALITKETVTTEDLTNFDRMIADNDLLPADITRMCMN